MTENEIIVNKMTVQICDRPYTLKKVGTSQEELIRSAEKEVNERVASLKTRIKGDAQDFLAMTALNTAMHLKEAQKIKNDSQLVSTVKNIIELLDDVLREE